MRLANRSVHVLTAIVLAVFALSSVACGASVVVDARPTPAFTPHHFPDNAAVKFLVIGDWGSGDRNQKLIAKRMDEKAAADGSTFTLAVGDNFYPRGVSSVTDPQWKTSFRDIYTGKSIQGPFYVALGNHDYMKEPQAEVDYSGIDPRWKMPERYYTFSQSSSTGVTVDFFALDTTPVNDHDKEYINKEVVWLEEQLKRSTAKWKIVYGHHPVYSNGKHGDNKYMIQYFKPLFEKYHVDLYLCGHDHDMQVIKPENGVHYILSGGASDHRDVKWRENTIYAQTNLGFVWCAVSDTMIEAQVLDRDGKIGYAYDITK